MNRYIIERIEHDWENHWAIYDRKQGLTRRGFGSNWLVLTRTLEMAEILVKRLNEENKK